MGGRGRRADDRGQGPEGRRLMAEVREQITDDGSQRTEGRLRTMDDSQE